jgi:hypothetical protein
MKVTLKELLGNLKAYDGLENLKVVLASDEEGNSFNELSGWGIESSWSLDGLDEGEDEDILVLWP